MEMCKEFFYRVEDEDDLTQICQKFNTNKENVLRNNASIPLYVGEWVKIKVNDYLTHHVKPAETLKDIAEKFSTTLEKLKMDNNLQTEKLFIGQELKIKLQ